MTQTDDASGITRKLATARFTDEMLANMRALIGTELRTAGAINNEFADRMAILRFCEGIGDDNPLWTDPDYAAKSQYGGLIAPPSFIFACLASVQFGWPGLGGFHVETTLDFRRFWHSEPEAVGIHAIAERHVAGLLVGLRGDAVDLGARDGVVQGDARGGRGCTRQALRRPR